MAEEHDEQISPSDFPGNFRAYIAHIQSELEAEYGDDAEPYESVSERAEAEAQFVAAQNWLVERWGEHFPCPVCKTNEWVVSQVGPAVRPAGYISFHVTCGYCGNTMHVVPGRAYLDTPQRSNQQPLFPDQ